MKHLLCALLFMLAAVAVGGCAPEVRLLDETKLKDFSLLSGEPCEAPCWNEFVPGETLYRDAKLKIDEDTRYTDVQEAERKEGSDARIFGFAPEEGQVCCQVFSRDGETVTSLLLQFAPDMSFGPVMDRYGEPTYVGGEAPAADQAYMALVYPEVPMVIYAFVAGAENGRLSTGSEILGAMYMSQDEMNLLLACSQLYDWGGFGGFNDYIDDNFDFVGEDFDNEEICGSA
ncbi:MAG: hypothetical protein OXE52_07420 [Chloroflexi bacterium]|nr:hypothetical protein [Chloroflexota bacterium]